MNFREFQSLCETDQLRIVIEHSAIAIREEPGFTVLLNKVEEFYVEIYFNVDEAKVAFIKATEAFNSLELYWNSVSIKEITRMLI